jgi:uncharacterized protein YjiS (DUF1127 family)
MTWIHNAHTIWFGLLCWMPVGTVFRWYRERHALNELSALSDAELKDIGVCRGSVPAIVRKQPDWTMMTP